MKSAATRKQRPVETKPLETTLQAVQERAYELYIQRGQQPGHELEDWLQAERELALQADQQSGT